VSTAGGEPTAENDGSGGRRVHGDGNNDGATKLGDGDARDDRHVRLNIDENADVPTPENRYRYCSRNRVHFGSGTIVFRGSRDLLAGR